MTQYLVIMESPSLLDNLLWFVVQKKLNSKINSCLIIETNRRKGNGFFNKLALLQVKDFALFYKLKRKLANFRVDEVFKNIEVVDLNSRHQFNDWLIKKAVGTDVQIVSVGCPFLINREVLTKLALPPVNLHNSDTDKIRGQFGTFWEYATNENNCVTFHFVDDGVDTGQKIVMRRINRNFTKSIFGTLVLKKIIGGLLIAEYVNGDLKATCTTTKPSVTKVQNWPTTIEILRVRVSGWLKLYRKLR